MPPQREPPPYTDKQLAAVAQGHLSGRERRLIATIRAAQAAANEQRERNYGGVVDALTSELGRLKEQLASYEQSPERPRVLISATRDHTIEVYSDANVRVQVICIPEARSNEGHERAMVWAQGKLPFDFQGMVDDPSIRQELYSVRCMSRAEWQLYEDRRQAIKYLERLEGAIETVANQTQEQQASEVGKGAPPAAADLPW